MKNIKRYTVTAALPYANGPVHIGHLAGVYIPADIYVRYLRMQQREVLFICGSDEHGVPITIKARREHTKPQNIVDKYHQMIKQAFNDLGISFNIYSRTSAKIHYQTASEFFTNLYEKGIFTEKTISQYFDNKNNIFLADRYITGECPQCHYLEAYGDQCEKCGSSLSPTDLINPKSVLSGEKPVLKDTKHWFLPLDKYEAWLKEWILDGHKNDWRLNVYGQCKSWIEQGLQPRAVTRDLDWGVPVPLDNGEAKGKVLYVWFEAPIGYISATREITDDWEKWWKDPQTKLVHFIGKDNIVFHCIIFPVMLKAEGSFILPENVPANEFLNLEGEKISTSKNWAVWLHEYLEDFPQKQDVLRYVLTSIAPETKDNDFTWKDFQTRNNSELVAILGNFVNRVMVMCNKNFEGKVPAKFPEKWQPSLNKEVEDIIKQVTDKLENYHFRDSLSQVMQIARLGNKLLTQEEPWHKIKEDKEYVGAVLNYCAQLIGNLAILLNPYLPFTSEKLINMLNLDKDILKWKNAGNFDLLQEGHPLNKPELLFTIIEDPEINKQLERLNKSKEMNTNLSKKQEIIPEITFDEFSKTDIRIALVLEAEKVPNTDKLMKLKLDFGQEIRTVISGIGHQFTPEQVLGRKVCYLTNLKSRNIKGTDSKGMILMVQENDGRLLFLSTEGDATKGAKIG